MHAHLHNDFTEILPLLLRRRIRCHWNSIIILLSGDQPKPPAPHRIQLGWVSQLIYSFQRISFMVRTLCAVHTARIFQIEWCVCVCVPQFDAIENLFSLKQYNKEKKKKQHLYKINTEIFGVLSHKPHMSVVPHWIEQTFWTHLHQCLPKPMIDLALIFAI